MDKQSIFVYGVFNSRGKVDFQEDKFDSQVCYLTGLCFTVAIFNSHFPLQYWGLCITNNPCADFFLKKIP